MCYPIRVKPLTDQVRPGHSSHRTCTDNSDAYTRHRILCVSLAFAQVGSFGLIIFWVIKKPSSHIYHYSELLGFSYFYLFILEKVSCLSDMWKPHGSMDISGGHLPSGPFAGGPICQIQIPDSYLARDSNVTTANN